MLSSLVYNWLNSWFSFDTVSSQSEGGVQEAMMPDAFASNHLVEDFSHSSVKSPKHLWDLTSTPPEQDDSELRH